ncbi:MAG TPA: acyltransferase family protein [Mycobacteriales bacterium]|nr:acyltransferase family protein [Mycobacteriales bacterium]
MTATTTERAAGFRADVEGLRAVAVGLVVAYHAGVPFLGGGFVGVDVFFVLSGFLITGLLAGELTESGSLSFLRFYGRRARRLLPLSTVVLVTTAIVFAAVLSPLDRGRLAADLRAAALYLANWHFAAGSLDYLHDPSSSPVLHYWSLAVEEQFYLVWPVLLVVAGRRAARRGRPEAARRRMTTALAVLAVGSLVSSIVITRTSSPYAYYGLHTRAWELAAGGLLALTGHRLRHQPSWLRALLAAVGLVTVVVSAVAIGTSTPFPGAAALGPVLGTVLVVAAGTGGVTAGAARLLTTRPFTYVGRLSYAWYLWHWPALVFAGTVAGPGAGPHPFASMQLARGWPALAAVAASFALSVAAHRWLEDPVRRSRWLAAVKARSLVLGAALTAASVTAIAVVLPVTDGATGGPVLAAVASVRPGKAVVEVSRSADREVLLAETPARARSDEPHGTRDCYAGYLQVTAPADCVFGDPHGSRTIALIGDSHAEQWFPALEQAAQRRHWRLWLWAKVACPMVALPVRLPQFDDTYRWCTSWRQAVLDRLSTLPRLDAIVVSHFGSLANRSGRFTDGDGTTLTASELPAAWQQAWRETGRRLAEHARRLVVIRDPPTPPGDVPACLAAHGADARPCSFPRSSGFRLSDQLYAAEHAAGVARQRFLDLDDLLCPDDPCPVVATDGTILYRDSHHLTASISRDLAPVLARRLRELL